MIHKNDIERLQTIVDTSSSLGEKLSRFAGKTLEFIISKIGLIIGSIILSVVFFTLGAIGRKKDRKYQKFM